MSDDVAAVSTVQHQWNDPDNDGHNCVDCADDSIWKCDRAAHTDSVLPPLTQIDGLGLSDPYDLLSAEERAELRADLQRMAWQRRTAGGNLG